MHRKAIKYIHNGIEIYLDPSSKAYELYKDKQWNEWSKHLDLLVK